MIATLKLMSEHCDKDTGGQTAHLCLFRQTVVKGRTDEETEIAVANE